jgi:23S rRNA (pseudouridine1915-N3)-methyltransferase
VKLLIIAVGRLRPPFVDDAEHYLRLLRRHARVEHVEVRDEAEAARRLPERGYTVLLDRGGDAPDSEQLASWLEERRQAGRDVTFAIGGPHGLDLPRVDKRLSFGAITLPHQLARVVLLEQLFRAHKILAGERYHY